MKLRIRHKLFFTILLSSSLVALSFYLVLQWNFDRGFVNYVNNQALSNMEDLGNRLAEEYSEETGWERLRNNRQLWGDIHRETLNDKKMEARPLPGDRQLRPPHPQMRVPAGRVEFLTDRSVLLDRNQAHVIGGPPDGDKIPIVKPIHKDGAVIGYLGLYPDKELMDARDLLFVEQQNKSFGLTALIMLAVSTLLTFPVAIHLLRPIKHLTHGTGKLIGGDYTTRVPVVTRDELGRLSQDFNILAMTLEKNETARQQWIADISHELRTPLAVLRGEVEAIQDGIRTAGPDTIGPVHSEILHLQRLVNDLYELSMSDIGALTYKKIPVAPLGILEESVELFEQRFAEKGLQLSYEAPQGEPGTMLGDPDRLHQLFTNVIENSLRYTDSPGNLVVSARLSANEISLCFEDSAPGVAEEHLPLLFQRLYRVDRSRKRAGNGAGLGLSICTNIVEAHQGSIAASKSEREGLKIEITFPTDV